MAKKKAKVAETIAAEQVEQQMQEAMAEAAMTKVEAASIMVQPRTLNIVKPAYFFLEPRPARREADKGNDEDQIERGVHQVDPNRSVSEVCIMPDLERLRATGNPYPSDPDDPKIVSKPRYTKFVPFIHALYTVLKGKTQFTPVRDMIDEACALSGSGKNPDGTPWRGLDAVAVDVMRDLRCYGLAVSNMVEQRSHKKTGWMLVDKPEEVQTIDEWRAAQPIAA